MPTFERGDLVTVEGVSGIGIILGWSAEYDAPMLTWIVAPRAAEHIYRHAHAEYDWCVGSAFVNKLTKIGHVDDF